MRSLAALLLGLLGPAGLAYCEGLTVLPGQWESTAEVSLSLSEDGEAVDLPVRTETRSLCLPAEAAFFSPEDLAGEDCRVSDVSATGAGLSFVLTCQRSGERLYGTMTASRNAAGTLVEAHMDLAGRKPETGEIRIVAHLTARQTGPCAAP